MALSAVPQYRGPMPVAGVAGPYPAGMAGLQYGGPHVGATMPAQVIRRLGSGSALGGIVVEAAGAQGGQFVPSFAQVPLSATSSVRAAGPPVINVGPPPAAAATGVAVQQPQLAPATMPQGQTLGSLGPEAIKVNHMATTVDEVVPARPAPVTMPAMQGLVTNSGTAPHDAEAELEALRRLLAAKEERIVQLTAELQAARDSEGRAIAEAEAVREVLARRDQEDIGPVATPPLRPQSKRGQATGQVKGKLRVSGSMPGKGAVQNVASAPALGGRSTVDGADVASPQKPDGHQRPAVGGRRAGTSPGPSRHSSRGTLLAQQLPQKDEIDVKLQEFLERSDCGLGFRRLNRGWYAFRRADERSVPSGDRSVELSIINGKLMARLEPSTHHPGWNNGKLGTIERFCAHIAAAARD